MWDNCRGAFQSEQNCIPNPIRHLGQRKPAGSLENHACGIGRTAVPVSVTHRFTLPHFCVHFPPFPSKSSASTSVASSVIFQVKALGPLSLFSSVSRLAVSSFRPLPLGLRLSCLVVSCCRLQFHQI